MNLSPKKQFLEKKEYARIHQDLVVSTHFRAAMESALLQQVFELPNTYDPTESAAAYYRIIGARDYIHYLLTIAEPMREVASPSPANLNHKVR